MLIVKGRPNVQPVRASHVHSAYSGALKYTGDDKLQQMGIAQELLKLEDSLGDQSKLSLRKLQHLHTETSVSAKEIFNCWHNININDLFLGPYMLPCFLPGVKPVSLKGFAVPYPALTSVTDPCLVPGAHRHPHRQHQVCRCLPSI